MLRRISSEACRFSARSAVPALQQSVSGERWASTLPVGYMKRGPGGRSSISGIQAAIFGSTGFLGRYVVSEIGKTGTLCVLPTRCNENARQHLRLMGDLGQLHFMDYDIRDEDLIAKAVDGADVVINLVGREFETGNFSFEMVNVDFAKRLAELSSKAGVSKLIHFSALGASTSSPSKFYQTKAAGEAAVLEAFPSATVIRPAPLVGSEDRLLNEYAKFLTIPGRIPLIDGGDTKMQPVNAADVAIALGKIVTDPNSTGKVYELAGPKVYKMKDLAALVCDAVREPVRTIFLPTPLAKIFALPRDILQARLPFPFPTNPMFTVDHIEGLANNYVLNPKTTALTFKDLGISPRNLEGLNIDYLRAFRSGGYDFGTTAGSA